MIRAALLLLLAAPAAAQDTLVFDPAPVAACLAEGQGDLPDCVGAASSNCMIETGHGFTTFGMAECTSRETEEWDRLLNEEYGLLRAKLDAEDAAETTEGFLDRSDALRDAQRAWIAYRDAECSLQWSRFQGGTMRTLIGAGCVLDFTARRTIELHRMRTEEGI